MTPQESTTTPGQDRCAEEDAEYSGPRCQDSERGRFKLGSAPFRFESVKIRLCLRQSHARRVRARELPFDA